MTLRRVSKEEAFCLDPLVVPHLAGNQEYLGFKKGDTVGSLGLTVEEIYEHPESSST